MAASVGERREKRGYVERVERSGEIMKRGRLKHGGVTIGTRTEAVKGKGKEKGREEREGRGGEEVKGRKRKEGGRQVKAT